MSDENGQEYLCVTCGAYKGPQAFEEGASTCNTCRQREDTEYRYDTNDSGRVTLRLGKDARHYHYARGTFRRLAEVEYQQPRQERLVDYWNRPSGEEIVQAMVEKGFDEHDARMAVRQLWNEQRERMKERGFDE